MDYQFVVNEIIRTDFNFFKSLVFDHTLLFYLKKSETWGPRFDHYRRVKILVMKKKKKK